MKKLLLALGIGLILGAVTSIGQSYIPEPFKQFANSYSVWLLIAYLFGRYGALNRKNAWVGGALIQIAALIGYYLVSYIRFETGIGSSSVLLMWIAGGVTAGPLLALVAYYQRTHNQIKLLAVGGMTLVILSEAAYMFIILNYFDKGLCFIGLALLFVISRLVTKPFNDNKN